MVKHSVMYTPDRLLLNLKKEESLIHVTMFENIVLGIFPGGPVVGTPAFSAESASSVLDGGTKIPRAQWYGQKEIKLY